MADHARDIAVAVLGAAVLWAACLAIDVDAIGIGDLALAWAAATYTARRGLRRERA